MKIGKIQVTNVLGISNVSVDTGKPIQIFGGENHSGKSSIQNAVRLALTGQPCRNVKLKKDLGMLVKQGSKKGRAEVTVDDEVYQAELPEMKGGKSFISHIEAKGAETLPVVLDPASFAAMKADDRRTFLMQLLDAKPTAKKIQEKCKQHNLDELILSSIIPMLRSGFPAACDHAKDKARDIKAEWKIATGGETWGADKAEDWEPELVEFDESALAEKQIQLERISDQIITEAENLGQIKQLKVEADNKLRRKGFLAEKAGKISRYEAAVEGAKKIIADQEKMLDRVRKNSGAVREDEILACPCCSVSLVIIDGALKEYAGVKKEGGFESIEKHEQALESSKRTLDNAQQSLDEAMAAKAELDSIQIATEEENEEYSDVVIEQRIFGLKGIKGDIEAAISDLKSKKEKADAAKEAGPKAKKLHEQITKYLKIADAFSPSGIPSELLREVLKPFNDRLQKSRKATSWLDTYVTQDFEIEANRTPYQLLSESEQWRVDAMIAEAISHFSGFKFVMLDGFDVLDVHSRGELINWMCDLAEAGDIDSALLFATLKAIPPSDDDLCQYHWIERGEIANKTEVAA